MEIMRKCQRFNSLPKALRLVNVTLDNCEKIPNTFTISILLRLRERCMPHLKEQSPNAPNLNLLFDKIKYWLMMVKT